MVSQRFETTARFECPKCDKHVSATVEVPEPNWNADQLSESGSEGETEVKCPECRAVFYAFCANNVGSCEITLNDHPNTTVDAELAMYSPDEDDWVDYEAPDDPTSIFMDSYTHTGDLLAEHGGDGAHLVNRMIFVQQIGAFEAYLADTLINFVTDDEEALELLLEKDKELAKEKFSLAEIRRDKELVKRKVLEYLRSILYHNIPKVHALYRIVSKVDLLAMIDAKKDMLFKAIEHRHDCVHRNGRDKVGIRLNVFTKGYVQEVADVLRGLVEAIDEKLYPNPNMLDDIVF
jgi:hypothetical protein